jgi:hypothetical protein
MPPPQAVTGVIERYASRDFKGWTTPGRERSVRMSKKNDKQAFETPH